MIHAAEARQLIAACRDHQERLDRIQALTRLLAAIVTAERRIEGLDEGRGLMDHRRPGEAACDLRSALRGGGYPPARLVRCLLTSDFERRQ
jgi:hypothetical protein